MKDDFNINLSIYTDEGFTVTEKPVIGKTDTKKNKNNNTYNKKEKYNSAIQKNCTCVSSFFNIELDEYQIEAIKLNGKHNMQDLCAKFDNHMLKKYDIDIQVPQQTKDIKEHTRLKSGVIGLMFMYENDFDKFEEIMKSIY